MIDIKQSIEEVLEDFIEIRDEFDWEMAGIVTELIKPIDNALKLDEIKLYPKIKNLFEKLKEKIPEIEYLLDTF